MAPTDAITAQPSRKRQRSTSMQSDTSSSSAKRSMSEGGSLESLRNPANDQLSHLTLVDSNQDIDAYMAEQGEEDLPTIPLPGSDAPTAPMSAKNKCESVAKEKGKQMQVGDTWYIVSRVWWKRMARACGGLVDKEPAVSEAEVGPVDNSSILDPSGNLRPGLVEGVDVEFVPSGIWQDFSSWYGLSTQSLPRRVIERGTIVKETVLEMYPPQIRVMRLSSDSPDKITSGPLCPILEISMGETVKDLCAKVAAAVKIDAATDTPFRVWKPNNPPDQWQRMEFPVQSLPGADAKVIDDSTKTLGESDIESGDLFIVEFKQNDGWLVNNNKAPEKSTTSAVEFGPAPLFNSKDGFFNKFGNTPSPATTAITKSADFKTTGFGSKSNSNFSIQKSYNKDLEPGTLGLGNMGNTCFMNSALQCLTHTEELVNYFLNDVFKAELNRDNPLGMHGAIAEVFGALMERIWASSGPSTSYSPREFKQTLQKFAPQFIGYQQHDSQELVAFLLDGLHEDLNRVLKKPYVEKPDWEGGGDPELVKLATDSWTGYMLRNDSVIVDLFQGQYQSTLVCPECQKISITFDPFMYLTLPLPVQKKWKHTIFYVPYDLEKPHVMVPIEINRDSSFKDLRNLMGRWVGAIPENLLMLEVFQHKFYKLLEDNLSVTEISDNDVLVCYELPCHARLNRTYKKKDDDPFIIPLFLSDAKPAARTGYGNKMNPSLFGYPTIVVIDRDQATSADAIYDAVIARLQRWTTNARDLYDWEEGPPSAGSLTIPIAGLPPMDSITEIKLDGDVVTVQEEGDISDEKAMSIDGDEEDGHSQDSGPHPYRTKRDIFNLKIYTNQKEYGAGFHSYNRSENWETWEDRMQEATDEHPILLREGDAFYAEFDEHFKAYFFGESRTFENACWNKFEEFLHPELAANQNADSARRRRGITLEDCLDEFVKEEQLGEEDLWYCPRCKKHQQATKKFDLWKAPDILVVHLKRFSNNRLLRDKIDTLVDFPIEGLDLSDKIGERIVAKRLKEQGVEMDELKQVNLDEPLLYDLFAVDEHMGGLGGGHYRAYAANHRNGKWYHFDDGYVTESTAESSVNPNAYLLFYRRRSTQSLGGETYQRAMQKTIPLQNEQDASRGMNDFQPLTPPSEPEHGPMNGPPDRLSPSSSTLPFADYWNDPASSGSSPPDFEDATSNPLVLETYGTYSFESRMEMSRYRRPSPTSSNEAEAAVGDDEDPWASFPGSDTDLPDWDANDSHYVSPSLSRASSDRPNLYDEEDEAVKVDVRLQEDDEDKNDLRR